MGADRSEYERRRGEAQRDWLQRLGPDEKLAILDDLLRFADLIPRDPRRRAERERLRWEQKLAARRLQVAAFQTLDRWRRGQPDPPGAH